MTARSSSSRQQTDCATDFRSSSLTSDIADKSSQNLPTGDRKSLEFFYNLGVDYFRQCIQHPPPKFSSQLRVAASSSSSSSTQATSTTPNTGKNCFRSARSASAADKSTEHQKIILDTSPYPPLGLAQSTPNGRGPEVTRCSSETLHGETHLSSLAVQVVDNATDDYDGKSACRVGSGAMHDQEHIDDINAKKLTNLSPQTPLSEQPDLVCSCTWTSERDSGRDSGCMSDLSSTTDDSTSAATSPYQSLTRDSTAAGDKAENDFSLLKNLNDLQLGGNQQRQTEVPAGPHAVQAALSVHSVQPRAVAPSAMPRYARPMRQIPARFQRLLAAEEDRVARLCQKLSGSSLYIATILNESCHTNESLVTSSEKTEEAYDVKTSASQPSYPLVYASPQYTGLTVYPSASEMHSSSCSSDAGIEPTTSYIVPIHIGDSAIQSCTSSTSTGVEGPPPSVPSVIYFPYGPSLPPQAVGSTIPCMIPTQDCAADPQWATTSEYVKRSQPAHIDAMTGTCHSVSNDGCSVYNNLYSPCTQLQIPCCSLQLL